MPTLLSQVRTEPDLDLVDTGREERVDDDVTEVDARDGERLAVDDDVLGERAGVDRGLDRVAERPRAVVSLPRRSAA